MSNRRFIPLVVAVVIGLVLGAGGMWLLQNNNHSLTENGTKLESGKAVTVTGKILQINTTAIADDAEYMNVQLSSGTLIKTESDCGYATGIGDIDPYLKVNDTVQIFGKVVASNTIDVCSSHYYFVHHI